MHVYYSIYFFTLSFFIHFPSCSSDMQIDFNISASFFVKCSANCLKLNFQSFVGGCPSSCVFCPPLISALLSCSLMLRDFLHVLVFLLSLVPWVSVWSVAVAMSVNCSALSSPRNGGSSGRLSFLQQQEEDVTLRSLIIMNNSNNNLPRVTMVTANCKQRLLL